MNISIDSIAQLPASIPPAVTVGGTAAQEAQDRFLKLLVTQMKNQDPLNPMDNAQVTTQMAQLSMVGGIDKLNATLSGMVQSLSASQILQAEALIGNTVLVPGSSMAFKGGSGWFGLELAQPVDSLVVTVRDAAGHLVNTVDLGAQPAGVQVFEWNGATASGGVAPEGFYNISFAAAAAGKRIEASALSAALVEGVSSAVNGVRVKLSGLGAVPLGDIKQVM